MPLGKPLLDTLNRMGYGGLILDTRGQVQSINARGRTVLEKNASASCKLDDPDWPREALISLLRSNGSSRFRMDEDSWVIIRRDGEGKPPLVLHAVSIANASESGPQSVVIMLDLQARPQLRSEALQKIFSLTPAEANLAVEMAGGRSSEEIAAGAGLKVSTVRKQLAAVFAKTNTRRQGELVALVAQLTILP